MDKFLSCDWGTSSFRLSLVNAENLNVIKTEASPEQGIGATYNLWKATRKTDPESRRFFYLDIIREYIEKIEGDLNISLQHVPLLLSGMASSAIGMMELPYRKLPFHTDGSDVISAYFEASKDFNHPVVLFSGVKSDDDVMRGEETQLVGCLEDQEETEKLIIFPGTHSKHVWVKGKHVTAFNTYMTGEIFEVLSKKSILRLGVAENQDIHYLNCPEGFRQGVQRAVEANLLQVLFRVRTNDLFGKLTKTENLNYLSGLLIGSELQEVKRATAAKKYLCCSSDLIDLYGCALKELGLHESVRVFPREWAAEAVIRGQFKMYTQFNRKQWTNHFPGKGLTGSP